MRPLASLPSPLLHAIVCAATATSLACSSTSSSGSPADAAGAPPVDASLDAAPSLDAGPSLDAAPSSADAGTGPGQMLWFIEGTRLSLLAGVDGGAALTAEYFDAPGVYVLSTSSALASVPPQSVASLTFTAVRSSPTSCGDAGPARVTGLLDEADAGFPPSTGAVLYDDEAWCFTPDDEKSSADVMRAAEEQAASAVHAAGLQMLTAPAENIVTSMPDDGGAGDRYLGLGIPAIAAANADVFEIQSQSLQSDAKSFGALVAAAALQARGANPHVKVLAGLSTNPFNGQIPSSYELCSLVMTTRATVDGYWLNVPEKGPSCPSCSTDPHPDVAVDLLAQLAAGACDPAVTP